ncbi:MAG TPA: hypothetical protein VGG10_22625 [Rhizomicrobium sp.]|jgi:hypothetical protein
MTAVFSVLALWLGSSTFQTNQATSNTPSATGAATTWKSNTLGNVVAMAKPRDRARERVRGITNRNAARSQTNTAKPTHNAKAIMYRNVGGTLHP